MVTTKTFLSHFGLENRRSLPDMEMLEDAGLLNKERLLAADLPIAIGDEARYEDDVDLEAQDSFLAPPDE